MTAPADRLSEIEALNAKGGAKVHWRKLLADAVEIARTLQSDLAKAHDEVRRLVAEGVGREADNARLTRELAEAKESSDAWEACFERAKKERDAARAERDGYFNRSEAFKLQAREARAEADALRAAIQRFVNAEAKWVDGGPGLPEYAAAWSALNAALAPRRGEEPAAKPEGPKCHCGGNHASTQCPTCDRAYFSLEDDAPKPEPEACLPCLGHQVERIGVFYHDARTGCPTRKEWK